MRHAERKGSNMANAWCSCGFAEDGAADEAIGDLFEVFAPPDGKTADGLVHLEGEASLFCLCGAGGSTGELDGHFLAVFTPGDLIGHDGRRHQEGGAGDRGREVPMAEGGPG
jgi:hypothetical protein